MEMALLAGIWLLVIFASLLLLIGTYTRIRDTAALAEAAVYGSSCAVSSSGNGVEEATGRLQGRETIFQFQEVKGKLPPASPIPSGFLSGISDGSRLKP